MSNVTLPINDNVAEKERIIIGSLAEINSFPYRFKIILSPKAISIMFENTDNINTQRNNCPVLTSACLSFGSEKIEA
jgi:hypothetical protein